MRTTIDAGNGNDIINIDSYLSLIHI
uniref:Uncharacterized protein n=1 Tax=Ralstonia solanacearum TaxID=305 RepID=A0A0S4X5J3_RALSL|nr:protein of unknown function [Ralstonia solanacearum]